MSAGPRRLGPLPRSVDALVEALLALAEEEGELPRVVLHLRGGRELAGYLVARVEERSERALVLEGLPEDRFRESDARSYVPAGEVQAVTVLDANVLAASLEAKRPAPSRLDLQRQAQDAGEQLGAALGAPVAIEFAWDTLPAGGESARALSELVRRTVSAVKATSADALGKEALAKVGRLVFAGGRALAVARDGAGLQVTAAIEHGIAGVASEDALKDAIDAAF